MKIEKGVVFSVHVHNLGIWHQLPRYVPPRYLLPVRS